MIEVVRCRVRVKGSLRHSLLGDRLHCSDYVAFFAEKRCFCPEQFRLEVAVEVKVIIIFPERFHEFFS